LTDFEIKMVEFLNEIAWNCPSTEYAETRARVLLNEIFPEEIELPDWAKE